MKNVEKKKGIFGSLFGSRMDKGGCCNVELEEITEEEHTVEDEATSNDKNNVIEKKK